ncbi:hypothetical protein NDU88_006723 [Pleurodeles waltl]|uniref:Uncharacterized protein n=1 Tax=Pleurodeles waltl TaxID=8319 RepID=A0AAV7WDD9_PLEWA|nr:hypothetical protein NDU88_006723 [Pleurodeles waltl]
MRAPVAKQRDAKAVFPWEGNAAEEPEGREPRRRKEEGQGALRKVFLFKQCIDLPMTAALCLVNGVVALAVFSVKDTKGHIGPRAHKDAWPGGTQQSTEASKGRPTENSPTVPGDPQSPAAAWTVRGSEKRSRKALPRPGRRMAAKRKERKPCRSLDGAWHLEEGEVFLFKQCIDLPMTAALCLVNGVVALAVFSVKDTKGHIGPRAHKDAWPGGTQQSTEASKGRPTENSPTVPGDPQSPAAAWTVRGSEKRSRKALPRPGRRMAAKRKERKPCRSLDGAWHLEEGEGKPCRGLDGTWQLGNRRNLTSGACFKAALSSEDSNVEWGLCASAHTCAPPLLSNVTLRLCSPGRGTQQKSQRGGSPVDARRRGREP